MSLAGMVNDGDGFTANPFRNQHHRVAGPDGTQIAPEQPSVAIRDEIDIMMRDSMISTLRNELHQAKMTTNNQLNQNGDLQRELTSATHRIQTAEHHFQSSLEEAHHQSGLRFAEVGALRSQLESLDAHAQNAETRARNALQETTELRLHIQRDYEAHQAKASEWKEKDRQSEEEAENAKNMLAARADDIVYWKAENDRIWNFDQTIMDANSKEIMRLNSELQKVTIQSSTTITELESKLEQATNKVVGLRLADKQHSEQSRLEVQSKNVEITGLREELQQAETEAGAKITELESELQRVETRSATRISELKCTISDLQSQIQGSLKDAVDLQEAKSKAETKISGLEAQLDQSNAEVGNLRQEMLDTGTRIPELEEELQKSQTEVTRLSADIENRPRDMSVLLQKTKKESEEAGEKNPIDRDNLMQSHSKQLEKIRGISYDLGFDDGQRFYKASSEKEERETKVCPLQCLRHRL